MRQVVLVLHADDLADAPSGHDLFGRHVTQAYVSHKPLTLEVGECREARVDRVRGPLAKAEHVAIIDHVEYVHTQKTEIVMHRLDQLPRRRGREHGAILPTPGTDLC